MNPENVKELKDSVLQVSDSNQLIVRTYLNNLDFQCAIRINLQIRRSTLIDTIRCDAEKTLLILPPCSKDFSRP